LFEFCGVVNLLTLTEAGGGIVSGKEEMSHKEEKLICFCISLIVPNVIQQCWNQDTCNTDKTECTT